MVCDRASIALNFLFLAILYPQIDYVFFFCFILDFGSHYLQFITTAHLKQASHKGLDEKVNWLVSLYYSNYTVFLIACAGTEVAAILLIVNKKLTWLHEGSFALPWKVVLGVFCCIMAFKMFVNLNQWFAGISRLVKHHESL